MAASVWARDAWPPRAWAPAAWAPSLRAARPPAVARAVEPRAPAVAAPAVSPAAAAPSMSAPLPGSAAGSVRRRRGRRSRPSVAEPADATEASSGRSPTRLGPLRAISLPATRSLRTRRLVTGGEPGRVSPIFGFGGGGGATASDWSGPSDVDGPSANTWAGSAVASSCSASEPLTTDMAVCRPRPPREPRRRRRETLVTAPSDPAPSETAPSDRAPSDAPLPSERPEASRELSGPTRDQSRCPSSIAGFSSPSRPNVAGSELALPASPSTGSDIETFPSKQARSGARRAHVATRTPGDIPGRAAGSQPRAVAPYF